jgi:hypothetical protein
VLKTSLFIMAFSLRMGGGAGGGISVVLFASKVGFGPGFVVGTGHP